MSRSLRAGAFAGLLLLSAAAPALAQIPGGSPSDVRTSRRSYLTQTFAPVHAELSRWAATWEIDDTRTVSSFFTDDVFLSPAEGAAAQGKAAARELLNKLLPVASDFRISNVDFAASGQMAYYAGRFSRLVSPPGGTQVQHSGTFVAVLYEGGRGGWQIRSYVEKLDAPAATAQAAAPGTEQVPAAGTN
jgi:ketosteroid isomerase-like protein